MVGGKQGNVHARISRALIKRVRTPDGARAVTRSQRVLIARSVRIISGVSDGRRAAGE